MRTLLALFLILPLTVQGQAIWRNFFVTNQNPRVTVVAGSNATVQASTVGVDQRIFTVNAIPGAGTGQTNNTIVIAGTNVVVVTNSSGGVTTYTVHASTDTNFVPAYAGFATNATYALWGTNSFYVLTAILTNQLYGSNIVGSVPEATHATNADNASNSTNFWGVLNPTNLPPGLATSNYVGTFTGNGAGLTNLSQGAYTGTVTNTINSTNVTLTGPLQIYGTSARTNGIYIDSSGEVLSNASGGVTIAGGNISATGSVVATNSTGTNWLQGTNDFGGTNASTAYIKISDRVQFRNPFGTYSNVFYIDPATGALLFNTTDKINIGASGGANRPNSVYASSLYGANDVDTASSGTFIFTSRTYLKAPAVGSFDISDPTGAKDRLSIAGLVKALTSSSAISLFTVTGRTNDFVGGTVDYTIFCTDNTEAQTYSGHVVYSCINTNGVWFAKNAFESGYTNAITSGTLTTAWGIIDDPTSGKGSTNVNVQVTATTSLTPAASKFYILWQLRNNGTNSITAL